MERDSLLNIADIVRHFVGQANNVSIPTIFKKWLGDYNQAVLLAQIIYWSKRTKNGEGWFYKTYADWEAELYLTENESRYAVGKLKSLGIIETVIKKANGNPTVHYRLKTEAFDNLFREFLRTEIVHPNDSICEISQNDTLPINRTIREITEKPLTQTTTQTTTKREHPPARATAQKTKPDKSQPDLPSPLPNSEETLLPPPRSVAIYEEVFPTHTIDGERYKMFCQKLPAVNEKVWRETLENWKLDGHRSGNLSGMIDRYEKTLKKLNQPVLKNGFIAHETKPQSKFLH